MKKCTNLLIIIFIIKFLIFKTAFATEYNKINKIDLKESKSVLFQNFNDVIYDGEKYIVVGNNGLIYTLNDNIEKSVIESNTYVNLKSITFKKDYGYIILGENNTLLFSKDTLYWEKILLDLAQIKEDNWKKIIYGNNKFIILGNKNILLSEDGMKWSMISQENFYDEKYNLNDIIVYNNEFIIMKNNIENKDENLFISSEDGYNWEEFVSDEIHNEFKYTNYKSRLLQKIMTISERSIAANNNICTNKEGICIENCITNIEDESKDNIASQIDEVNIKDSIINEGNRETFYLKSKSTEKVQYRIFLYYPNEETWEELTEGYTKELNPSITYSITPNKKFEKGVYMVTVWVKSANEFNTDSHRDYDNISVAYLKCVDSDYNIEKKLTQEQIYRQYISSLVTPSVSWAVINKDNKIGKKGEKVEILMDKDNGKVYKINKDDKILWINGSLIDVLECPPVNKNRLSDEESEMFINSKDFYSTTPYFIWVDIDRQLVNIYKYESKKYNLVKTMICATGKVDTPTVRGEYTIKERGKHFYSRSVGMGAKYWVRFYENYLFHSFPIDSMGNILDANLGERASHGCIRLSMEDSKWIYDNITYGTKIWIN